MSNVTELRQPLRKRFIAWLKSSREDRIGWLATVVVLASIVEDARGHTDKATYTLCLAILLLLIIRPQQN